MEELVMLLLGFGILLFFIAVVLLIIYILAYWMIFNKAGEPGWKALIPIYSTYTEYKLVWNTKMFAVFMAFVIVTAILERVDGMLFLYYAASIGTIVMNIMACVKMSMSFGHGTGLRDGARRQSVRGFYEHMGFEVYQMDELDGQGNPFPILHMRRRA